MEENIPRIKMRDINFKLAYNMQFFTLRNLGFMWQMSKVTLEKVNRHLRLKNVCIFNI